MQLKYNTRNRFSKLIANLEEMKVSPHFVLLLQLASLKARLKGYSRSSCPELEIGVLPSQGNHKPQAIGATKLCH